MIRIGIYDRYLSTAGGGERYSCKMAEILSKQKDYSVDLITDIYSDLDNVASRLNLDLKKVNLKVFPFLSEDYAARITGKYDIFINSTYLSSLSAAGKRNLYLCYFPTPFDVDFKFLHRFLLLFFRFPAICLYRLSNIINSRDFDNIEVVEGIYDIKRFFLRRGCWSSGNVLIRFKNSGKKIRIGIKNPASACIEEMKCSIALYKKDARSLISNRQLMLKKGQRQSLEMAFPSNEENSKDKECILNVVSDTFFLKQHGDSRKADTRKFGCVLYNEIRTNIFKKIILKVLGFIPLFLVTFPRNLNFIDSYDEIISISKYSSKWIKRFWKKESTTLYPPVDTHSFKVGKKQKIILSVGRFFPYHHNKKQLELAKCFIDLYKNNKKLLSGYQLYLAGGVENKQDHLDYVEKIESISAGFPIRIFKNLSWKKLLGLFSIASIFWHASGLGENEDRHPEKFEHFGITTVEAMAAGCIPVVINSGGQSEIIEDGYNGFLFDDLDQLKMKTLNICKEKTDYNMIRKNAVKSSKKFSSINFEKDLLGIISRQVKKL